MTHPDAFDRERGTVRDPFSEDGATDDARFAAGARRDARQRRTRTIRRRVAIGAVTLFLAAWSAIFVQMVTGHDPVLARQAVVATTTPSTASAAAESGGSESADGASESGSSAALTTGQS